MNYPKNRYSGESPWMDKDWLFHQYIELDKSSKEIADEYGCVRNTVQQWLATYKILKENIPRHRETKHKYQQKDFLYHEHVTNNKSMTEIANECNISGDTIRRYLLKYNIPIHHTKELGNLEGYDIYDLYVNKKMSAKQIVELVKCSHDTIINKLNALGITGRTMSESQFNYLNKDINPLLLDRNWLYETYIENGISAKEIGEMIGHCAGTIRRWLKKHKIKLRSNAESKIGLMSGSKHPNWQGGISELKALCREYFTVNIVPKIAERDNYTCQLCNKQHCVLHIHHIYSFKDIIQDIISKYSNLDVENPQDKEKLYYIIVNDSLFNDESNLITYCKECHLFKIHKYIQRQSATKSR